MIACVFIQLGYYTPMSKPVAYFTICFALTVIGFGTWQLFVGNFTAAFSSLPFLLIIYLYVIQSTRKHQTDEQPPTTPP